MANHTILGIDEHKTKDILALVKQLQQQRRHRDSRGVYFVEGVRNFVHKLDHQQSPVAILYSEGLLTVPLARKLVRQKRREGVPTIRMTPEEFRSISITQRASGVGVIARQHWTRLERTDLDAHPGWTILGHVRSPGNFGTLIRTSAAVGAYGFILTDQRVDPFAPETVRASMGSVFAQRFIRTDIAKLKAWAEDHGCRIIGTSPKGEQAFHLYEFPKKSLVFLGEERFGLTLEQTALCNDMIRIPMMGDVDSLNLGVACSLILYEEFRSRDCQ